MFPRPIQVEHIKDFVLHVEFDDGVVAELDFSPLVDGPGLFGELRNGSRFSQVRIDREAQTLAWPNGVDVCPDVLYHIATGVSLPGELPRVPARLVRLLSSEAAQS